VGARPDPGAPGPLYPQAETSPAHSPMVWASARAYVVFPALWSSAMHQVRPSLDTVVSRIVDLVTSRMLISPGRDTDALKTRLGSMDPAVFGSKPTNVAPSV
jgi:hypothetical protein